MHFCHFNSFLTIRYTSQILVALFDGFIMHTYSVCMHRHFRTLSSVQKTRTMVFSVCVSFYGVLCVTPLFAAWNSG